MAWKEVTPMKLKEEFVQLAKENSLSFSELCRRFGVSRKTGYKLLSRYQEAGKKGLEEKSRRPIHSPTKTPKRLEEMVIQLRLKKPYWGGRKIKAYLEAQGETQLPSASAISKILKRHGLVSSGDNPVTTAYKRFEHELPNDLWQIDFKGHIAMRQGRCHPLTILDDHSRFSIGLKACANESESIVKQHLIQVLREYGLPWRMNFDNGSPWASTYQRTFKCTSLTLWLMRLGIQISFSRLYHPQTNGKDERFHRTLKLELLQFYTPWNLEEAQHRFDQWRQEYNLERPHEALGMKPPIVRYKPSARRYPEQLPPIEYLDQDTVVTVNAAGNIRFQNKVIFISESFRGQPVAIRHLSEEHYALYFCNQKVSQFDMKILYNKRT